ncbi:MAG: hypothetical protein IJ495_05680 [Bacteroidales bacterium]|nr:hypothetical protein [Bacteroidales bacterium]
MIGFIIWLVGVICCIWCIKDVWSKGHVDALIKILLTVCLLCFSWIGLAVYYFVIKDRI